MSFIKVDKDKATALKEQQVRVLRLEKLSSCDWTQLVNAKCDKVAWATYRQALRDIPSQDGFPYSVMWPTKP